MAPRRDGTAWRGFTLLLIAFASVLAAPGARAQNAPPLARNDVATVAEDTRLDLPAAVLLANDRLPANSPTSIVSVGTASNGVATLTPGGDVTYTPAANFNGTDSFTYTISDTQGRTSTATVTVTVTPVNDPPVARDDAAATSSQTPVVVNVLANDTDVDGDALTVTAVTQPASGTAVVSGGGSTVTYTPAASSSGAVTFTYTVSDGRGGTATATVTVQVSASNAPPVAVNDAVTTAEDTAVTLDVLANDSDPDGDALTVASVMAPANGTATAIGGGLVRYTPAANFNGTDSFTYTASDGRGGTATATVSVTVTPVNDPPVAVNDQATVLEDGRIAIGVLANDSDPDGDALTVASVADPANGTATTDGVTVTYAPDLNFNGSDAFAYTISDGNGGTATATVTVTVTPVNDPPVARDDAAATSSQTPVVVNVLANDTDVDGDALTVTAVTQPASGTAVVSGGGSTVTYTPAASSSGAVTFTYTVSDGRGGTATATVTVQVSASNAPPVAVNDAVTTAEDTAVTLDVLANDSDPDGDALTVASVMAPANGTATAIGGGLVRYTPAANFNGTDSFTYTASDGRGGTATATVSVTVTPVNDPPVAVNDQATVLEDGRIAIGVLANDSDPDGDALTVASVADPANGTATTDGVTVTYAPDLNFNGSDAFAYTISDGNGGTATATVTVTVTPVNDPPVARDDAAATSSQTPVVVNVLANDTDVDGDALTVTAVTQPASGTAVVSGGGSTVTYTPAASSSGAVTFTYTVSDGRGGTATATVTVQVSASNAPPVAVNDAVTTAEDTAVTLDVLANDSDPDGDALTVASVTAPANGTATAIGGGLIRYTPAANFRGSDAFSYTVSDGRGGAATATVSVTVTPQAVTVTTTVDGDARAGTGVVVSVTAAGFSAATAELYYRPGGARDFGVVPLVRSGARFVGTIPAEAVTLRGVDYYVFLSDGATTVTDPGAAPAASPRHIRVRAAVLQAPVAFTVDGYQMLSVPLALTDGAPAAVFADDYGAYDPLVWRLLRWAPGTGAYAEYPSLGRPIAPGVGFWLAARAGSGFDVENVQSVAATMPVTLVLQPGWNQIGSPFYFPVAWESVEGIDNVSPPAAWDGAEYVLDRPVLQPWQGYFVENLTGAPVELLVPPVAASSANGADGGAALRAGNEYRLHLRADAGEHRDSYNVLGFAENATRGRDRSDLAEPPPFGDHVRFSFVTDGVRLARSLQPDMDGGEWEAEVGATAGLLRNGPLAVHVRLSEEAPRPVGYGRYILDLDRGVALSLAGDSFGVTLSATEPVRRLRVIVGTEAFAASAARGLSLDPPVFALEQAWPNPFRQSATFAFQIPEPGPVTLEVFDLLGRRVAVLVDGEQEAGRHTATWDTSGSRSLAGGVYVYRLRAGGLSAVGKVVLVR